MAVAVLLASLSLVLGERAAPAGAGSLPAVPGAGAPHPRVQYSPGDEAMLRDRLTREPYRTVFVQMSQRAKNFDTRPLGDMSVNAQRDLSRAAKVMAFQYSLDRTLVGGQIVPFADDAAHQATGDRVRELLLNLFPRSRLAVPPPIGGWDRDISTAEEITNYSEAFDTMLGAGYDFGDDRETIVDLLSAVTGELYRNFLDPSTASNYTDLHQNNHRSKSGAAMATAAIVLADDVPEAREWFDYGVLLVDDVLRYMLVTGDGAYAEGPFYYRLTMQNVLPLAAAWERLLGAESWFVGDVEVPAIARDPLFRRTQRWMLDATVPDGTMAPIDDGNPGRSMYFGAMPTTVPDAAAAYWRWPATPQPFETDGSVELGPDTIVAYDEAIEPTEPWWAPTQFYVEGGTAMLRSDWQSDATMALVLGEHDTASEFGRDRLGVGRAPQSHEHADAGSFLLHAFGERLALDPGYLSFTDHHLVNRPEHHNMVLVDGQGPPDYLVASLNWLANPLGRPPAEGQSTLHDTLDGSGLDATSVATWYRNTEIGRRFLMADDRYLVIGDRARGQGTSLQWMQHGNGGGTSGGTFAATATGGRWQIGGARLDTGVSVADQLVSFSAADAVHEIPFTQQRTHTALRASVPTGNADALQLFYPTPAGAAPPTITDVGTAGSAGLELVDTTEDRRVVVRKGVGLGMQLVDERLDGALRLAYADGVTSLVHDDRVLVQTATAGTLGLRMGESQTEVVAQTGDSEVSVGSLGFEPVTADGACGLDSTPSGSLVHLNRERRFTLRADGGNARPAADAGPTRRVTPGDVVTLDGSASCDADGDALTPRWELVSAPAGSAWTLTDADTIQPQLHTDRVGPYRVRLTVTDSHGATSLEQEVLIVAGPRCGDGMDNDLDGRIDTDDVDCDGPDPVDPSEPAISIGSASLVEGDGGKARSARFAVTLSKPSPTPVSVRYMIESSSTGVRAKTGVLTFKPNARTGLTPTTKFVSANVIPDLDDEVDETFRVVLSEPSAGYTIRNDVGAGVVIDDDPNDSALAVSIGDASAYEGDECVTLKATNRANLRITLNRPATTTVTVQVAVVPGSATPGSDIKLAKPKTITFKPGQMQKSVGVPIIAGTDPENVETVTVQLSNPSAGLVVGRGVGLLEIIDDD
jgi:hypothetical protein